MKKLMFFFITMMITLVMETSVTSCDHFNKDICPNTSSTDSTAIFAAIDEYHNPAYTDAAEFRAYLEQEVVYYDFVSVCKYLHPNTVESIATACIKEYGRVDHILFMQEFHDNETAYTNVDKVNWKNDDIVLRAGPSGQEKTLILDSVTTNKEGI